MKDSLEEKNIFRSQSDKIDKEKINQSIEFAELKLDLKMKKIEKI